jgi:glycosyltransferase involved in cell wall biosynthesis
MEQTSEIPSAGEFGASGQRAALGSGSHQPLVSVIIPTYNSAQYLPETIESVLSQSWKNFEIIVVDDGSTDNTSEILRGIQSDKIQYIRQDNSGGPSKPRNVGIHRARGKYVALFDSDDLMAKEKLEEAVGFLERYPDLGLLFANFEVCNERGEGFPGTFLDGLIAFGEIQKKQVGEKWFIIESAVAYQELFLQNFIGTSGVVVPKSVFLSVGGFDESIAGPEDRDMWLRISNLYSVGYLDIVGHRYRRRQSGIMGRGPSVLAPYNIRVWRKQLEAGLPHPLNRQARRNIAAVMFDLGYYWQSIGDFGRARVQYWSSIKESFSVLAVKGLLVSCLGKRFVAFLKNIRG